MAQGPLKLLLVDHADSFTWNLADLLHGAGQDLGLAVALDVVRATDVRLGSCRLADGVVLSPGPNGPEDAPASCELVRRLVGRKPLLGVCLGMQIVATALGGRVVRAPEPVHGKRARVRHDAAGLFAGLPQPFEVMRYHSLAVDVATLPAGLHVSAWLDTPDGRGLPMALRGVGLEAVQFHPESVGTPLGPEWARAAVRWIATFPSTPDTEP